MGEGSDEWREKQYNHCRASIMDALQVYLLTKYSKQESIYRFGNIMLLIGKVQQ